jgi:cold shock CspA family protein
MSALKRGRVVRFNAEKGYGFIAPADADDDEDVFFHVSTLTGVNSWDVRPGMSVEYDAVDSDGGFKAVLVKGALEPSDGSAREPAVATRIENRASPVAPVAADSAGRISRDDFARTITDVLIESAPTVTAREIVAVRDQLVQYARSMGWLQS